MEGNGDRKITVVIGKRASGKSTSITSLTEAKGGPGGIVIVNKESDKVYHLSVRKNSVIYLTPKFNITDRIEKTYHFTIKRLFRLIQWKNRGQS